MFKVCVVYQYLAHLVGPLGGEGRWALLSTPQGVSNVVVGLLSPFEVTSVQGNAWSHHGSSFLVRLGLRHNSFRRFRSYPALPPAQSWMLLYAHARLTRHILPMIQQLPFPDILVANACCDRCLKPVRPLHDLPDWGVDISRDTCSWSGSAVVE